MKISKPFKLIQVQVDAKKNKEIKIGYSMSLFILFLKQADQK